MVFRTGLYGGITDWCGHQRRESPSRTKTQSGTTVILVGTVNTHATLSSRAGIIYLCMCFRNVYLTAGTSFGIGVVELLLLWSALNFCKAITATWGGQLADRFGRGRVMLISWIGFALMFLMLSQVTESTGLWLAVIFYGLFTGLSEGAERALISDYAETNEHGTAFLFACGFSALAAALLQF